MLNAETKRKIQGLRDTLVGKIPVPTDQVKQITLGLIYKFMSDIDKENTDILGGKSFFSGEYEKYSWDMIIDKSLSSYERVTLYSEGLEKMSLNPNIPELFRDIFKNAYLPFRDPATLSQFLIGINEFNYDHSEDLGDAFEFLLSVMGSQGDAGQFRTPRHIIDFIVKVVEPKNTDKILDPACGTAGFLISAYKYILDNNKASDSDKPGSALSLTEKNKLTNNFIGYDISTDMVRLSLVNMYLHNFANPNIKEYDTLTSEELWDEDFDCIMANPPFMTPKGGIRPHKRFAIRANRSEVLFVDYITEHLLPNGKAGVIVPEGIIFQLSTAYKNLRKMLVDENYLYAVVSLPIGVFQPYSNVKTSILFMDKTLSRKTENILFLKIENDGFEFGAQRKPVSKNDLPLALDTILRFKKSINNIDNISLARYENPVGILIKKSKIKEKKDYSFSIEKYKEIPKYSRKQSFSKLSEIIKETKQKAGQNFGDYKVCTISSTKGICFQEDYFTKKIASSDRSNYKIVEPNSFAYRPPGLDIGTLDYNQFSFPVIVSPLYIVFKVNEEKVNTEYLYRVLKNQNFKDLVKPFMIGSARPQVNYNSFKDFIVPLPTIEVQNEIVEKLNKYQKLINNAKQIIENWKPEIDIDSSWKIIKLKDICFIKSGGTPSRDNKKYWNGKIPWYSSGELNGLYTTEPKEMITKIGLDSSNATIFSKGSLLIGMYDTAAFKMSLLDRDAAFNQAICGVKTSSKIDLYFLYLYFKSKRNEYLTSRVGVRQRNLSKNFISNLSIPLPPLKIQKQIVDKIETEHEHIKSTEELIRIFEEKIEISINSIWQK